MKGRCLYPSHPKYAYYGGRGITICDEWMSFADFFADMGTPEPGMTLERRDPDGDYCKGNCRWASRAEQSRNHRGNKLTAEAVAQLRAEYAAGARTNDLAAKYGITRQMVRKTRLGECWK